MTHRTVQAWMTSPVVMIAPGASLNDARLLMAENKIRALPVVNDGELVGIITRRGLLYDISYLDQRAGDNVMTLTELTIRDVMTTKPIVITATALVARAARIMLENKITALPVVEEGKKLTGILTNSDLMRFIVNEYPGLKKTIPVSHYMNEEVVTIDEETSLLEMHRLMGTKRIRALPVMREESMVGLVTRTDLMRSDPSRLAARDNQNLSLQILAQPAEKIMTQLPLLTIAPEAPVSKAAHLMLKNKIHCLPVVNQDRKLAGIITETDLYLMIVQKF